MFVSSRLFLSATTIVPTVFALTVSADVFNVGQGQTYATIQDAVDAASHNDVILVHPGVYKGTGDSVVNLQSKSLQLISTNGKGSTYIDGELARRCINAENAANGTYIQGFTIQNGASTNFSSGAGLRASNGSIMATDCAFSFNDSAMSGGGAYLEDVTAMFKNCTFSGNKATSSGAGIYVEGGSLTLEGGTSVRQNTAGFAGGIFCNGTAVLKDVLICSNAPSNLEFGPNGTASTNSYTQVKNICPDIELMLAIAKNFILYEIANPIPDPGPYQIEVVGSLGWLINPAAFEQAPDGQLVVVDPGLGMIAGIDLNTGEFLGEEFQHEQIGQPTAIGFTDGVAAVADAEMGVFVFESDTGEFMGKIDQGGVLPTSFADAGDGSMYISGNQDGRGSVQKWNVFSGEMERSFQDESFRSGGPMVVRMDGSLLVSDELSAKIHIFSADGAWEGYFGSPDADGSVDFSGVTDMDVAPDGTIYVVANDLIKRYSQGGAFMGDHSLQDDNEGVAPSHLVFAEPDPVPWTEGDLNGDERVNGADLGLMLAAWGVRTDGPADINKDGFVSGADLGQLLANWTG